MRLKFDKENDALFLRLDEEKIIDSEEIQPGIILDFNKEGKVTGVEFLNISERVPQKDLSNFQYQAV
ncbi:MAG: hypothetical protein A2096_12320 [Spirochaetes bacterium GWF1_41_5]|nr:MAG: hypothetical protein A2096_12320 [Spirochaetes bacterium GWF1_41_5]HBE01778.1 hypothetical protein [Spirochaetia bacterium]